MKKELRIVSWTVNGVRAAERKGFLDWLTTDSPDILCLQETKAHPDQLSQELLHPDGYSSYWHLGEKKGYSGVAMYSKEEPIQVKTEFGYKHLDAEGRTMMAEYEHFYIINGYHPNGGRGDDRVAYKLAYYAELIELSAQLKKSGKAVILTGDFNTAHKEIDLARPKENVKNSGFLPQEREALEKFFDAGFVDTFRMFYPDKGEQYTWWDMKTFARNRNVGWRIDYFMVDQEIKSWVKDAFILQDILGSDHAPVGITLRVEK